MRNRTPGNSAIHRSSTGIAIRLAGFVLMAALPLAWVGCTSSRKQTTETQTAVAEHRPESRLGVPDAEPGDRIVTFDVNRSGRPNIFHHYRTLDDGTEQLVRKDIDLSGNGRIDVWRFYEDGERVVKEAFDLDFDGVVDVWNFFDEHGRLVRKEADLNLDGASDVWKYYEDGRLVRKERDTSGNGRPDYFEFWEDGEIDRVGEDLNGDGTVDRWTRRTRE